jgi:adenosine deaminase
VEELQADRIGHGISAVRDLSLMEYLAENSIGVECNLTSNYQTQSVPDLTRHPLKTFLDRGVLATINTDDPGISGITLEHEYRVAREIVGLSESQLAAARRNSLRTAFLSEQEKEQLLTAQTN